jgi:o-succinylbenzoate---CoA ligase
MELPFRLIQDGELCGSADSFPDFAVDYARVYEEILVGKSCERAFFSSGSTSAPRSYYFSERQIEVVARRSIAALGLREGCRVLLALPLSSVAARMVLIRAYYGGHTVDVLPARMHFWPEGANSGIYDFLPLSSAQALACLERESSRRLLFETEILLLGGSELPPRLVSILGDRKNPAFQSYGMTETLSHIALRRLTGSFPEPYSLISDKTELFYHDGDLLGIQDSEFLPEPVFTQDRVELLEDGSFWVLGRVGNVINMGGLKLQAELIETAIGNSIPEGLAYYVSAMPDAEYGWVPALSIEGTEDLSLSLEAINNHLYRRERIRAIRYLPQFERTESGKIVREPFG